MEEQYKKLLAHAGKKSSMEERGPVLVDAANGVGPRTLRDRALAELLYGACLRVSEAVGLERGSVEQTALAVEKAALVSDFVRSRATRARLYRSDVGIAVQPLGHRREKAL